MAPLATRAARAAWGGTSGYCSATATSPESPTADQSPRSPSRSGAGGVSASTGSPRSTASTMKSGVSGFGVAVSTKSTGASRRQASREEERSHLQVPAAYGPPPRRSGRCPARGPPRAAPGTEAAPDDREGGRPRPRRVRAGPLRRCTRRGGGSGEGGHDVGLEASEDHRPGALHERRLIGGVDQLVHHDPAAVTVGMDPQIAGQRLPGHRNVAVVEVPAHHDQLRRDHELVSSPDLGAPLQRGREPVAVDGDRDLEPARVQLGVGQGGEGGLGRRRQVHLATTTGAVDVAVSACSGMSSAGRHLPASSSAPCRPARAEGLAR